MVTGMSAWQQQKRDDLRRSLADHLARRATLADVDALRRLDADIEALCRNLYDAERRMTT
jgi:hypothetical protein